MSFASPTAAVPTVQRDDEQVCVTRWDFAPGAATGWHRHEYPYFVVMLTDAVMHLHNGSAVTEVRRAAGESYSRPAGIEHDVMNAAATPMAFVEIEIKHDGGRLIG
jgi:quercetin dioxygenase-like cupin family protein